MKMLHNPASALLLCKTQAVDAQCKQNRFKYHFLSSLSYLNFVYFTVSTAASQLTLPHVVCIWISSAPTQRAGHDEN